MENELKAFIAHHDSLTTPLSKAASLAYWNASNTGDTNEYAKVDEYSMKLTEVYANKEAFAKLKTIKESNAVKDSLLMRQLDVLYRGYQSAQVDTAKLNAVIHLSTEIEQKYSNFRADIKGKKLSDNDIEQVLKTSVNSQELKDTWMAHKKIGPVVADDIRKLVKMRNEIAKELGFNNYHEMSLKLSDQDPAEISKIFDELDQLTRESFAKLKGEIDENFAKRYKIKKEELMPWHYQNRYFQEAPELYPVNLDKLYASKDLVETTRKFYDGIGLPIDDLLKKSDLFEREKKNQHAYCIDIDNEGDVRILCNVKPTQQWMNTMLHEYGHGVYDKFINRELPRCLREPAHTFTTEAIAMLMGRLASNPQWMKDMIGISEEEKAKIAEDCFKTLRLEQLVFSRWAQVMYRFEKSMYENPDQDLNKLWWDLVEKYQMVKRPADRNEPDWATKIHIATSPCYYHNYLLGEMLASQLHFYIVKNILKSDDYKNASYVNNKEIGKFLMENVFKPGALYPWNTMIERATGEKLSAKYYAKQFVD